MLCIKQVVYIQFTYLRRHVSISADWIISISLDGIHTTTYYSSAATTFLSLALSCFSDYLQVHSEYIITYEYVSLIWLINLCLCIGNPQRRCAHKEQRMITNNKEIIRSVVVSMVVSTFGSIKLKFIIYVNSIDFIFYYFNIVHNYI